MRIISLNSKKESSLSPTFIIRHTKICRYYLKLKKRMIPIEMKMEIGCILPPKIEQFCH